MRAYGHAVLVIVTIILAAAVGLVLNAQADDPASPAENTLTDAAITQVALTQISERTANKVLIEIHGGTEPIDTDELLITLSAPEGSEALRIG